MPIETKMEACPFCGFKHSWAGCCPSCGKCPGCGYTEEDKANHMDHRLCPIDPNYREPLMPINSKIREAFEATQLDGRAQRLGIDAEAWRAIHKLRHTSALACAVATNVECNHDLPEERGEPSVFEIGDQVVIHAAPVKLPLDVLLARLLAQALEAEAATMKKAIELATFAPSSLIVKLPKETPDADAE